MSLTKAKINALLSVSLGSVFRVYDAKGNHIKGANGAIINRLAGDRLIAEEPADTGLTGRARYRLTNAGRVILETLGASQ